MAGITLSRTKDVWVATLRQHAFVPGNIKTFHRMLDEVERSTGPCGLVITASGKIFNTGLDLQWTRKILKSGQANVTNETAMLLMKLCGRVLTFPVPTVAAINGLCYGGGLMLACACDHRIINESVMDVCMPLVNINLPAPRGGLKILYSKLSRPALKELTLTGGVYTAKQMFELGVVDKLVPKESLLPSAIELAQSLAHLAEKREIFGYTKRQLYKTAAILCEDNTVNYEEAIGISKSLLDD